MPYDRAQNRAIGLLSLANLVNDPIHVFKKPPIEVGDRLVQMSLHRVHQTPIDAILGYWIDSHFGGTEIKQGMAEQSSEVVCG